MQNTSSVSQLGEDIGRQLQSFISLLESIHTQDSELAEVLAEDFSNRMRESYRQLFVEMTKTISEELSKDPSKRMKPKKRRGRKPKSAVTEVDTTDISDSGVGVEELEENPQSLLRALEDGEDVNALLGNAMQSGGVTKRAAGTPPSSWDRENPTMRRIDPDA
jgi:hypothetical protein